MFEIVEEVRVPGPTKYFLAEEAVVLERIVEVPVERLVERVVERVVEVDKHGK